MRKAPERSISFDYPTKPALIQTFFQSFYPFSREVLLGGEDFCFNFLNPVPFMLDKFRLLTHFSTYSYSGIYINKRHLRVLTQQLSDKNYLPLSYGTLRLSGPNVCGGCEISLSIKNINIRLSCPIACTCLCLYCQLASLA